MRNVGPVFLPYRRDTERIGLISVLEKKRPTVYVVSSRSDAIAAVRGVHPESYNVAEFRAGLSSLPMASDGIFAELGGYAGMFCHALMKELDQQPLALPDDPFPACASIALGAPAIRKGEPMPGAFVLMYFDERGKPIVSVLYSHQQLDAFLAPRPWLKDAMPSGDLAVVANPYIPTRTQRQPVHVNGFAGRTLYRGYLARSIRIAKEQRETK